MVNKFKEALTDANKCIEIDGNWAKGYTRKGDAQYKLLQFTDAYNAYNSAKRLSPGDKSLEEKCDLAMKAIGIEADRAAGSSASRSASRSATSTAAVSPTGIIGKVITYSRYLLILAAICYLIPLGRTFCFACFKVFAVLEIIINTLSLYSKYGIPKFNMEYASKLIQDTLSIHLFLAIILIVSRPYMFAMAPILLTELSYMSGLLFTYCREIIPAMEAQIKPMIQRFMPAMANQDISTLFSPAAEKQFSFQMVRNAAMCEVMQGVFLIVEMILPTRNLVMAAMWWQYLQMRYMMDKQGGVVKQIF
jgi:tetratricopeptide (TPR) repeat protein